MASFGERFLVDAPPGVMAPRPGGGGRGAAAGRAGPRQRQQQQQQAVPRAQPQQQQQQRYEAFPPPPEASVEQLTNMGFEREAVLRALRESHNNLERAADRLLTGG
eukprot:CAMPEP_0194026984 /NCGR_PEP_ID=MMETSP0009_2-20130614/1223_1 /TAXON_ID=210454 /ORGANISM="Grammatophora oceanica, Strain CCMP 410" /LENGTH=105 /DNA_ID=CAMNT_0038665897 /DNA_START=315 /DNA_END=635 /DNA_ORIENTATION=-